MAPQPRQSDFERVYEEQVASVYGFLAYRSRDRELAEDLTQATFERALRGWSRFDPRRASVRTWLLVIARNLLIDHHRKRSEVLVAEVDDRALGRVDGPEQQLGVSAVLLNALAELSDRDREVVALRYGGDLTGPEIAELLGLTLANVQQILSRSLRRLRALLGESGAVRNG
jgi:RNA polymerase sigma factor (sigma-70 family)